MNHYAFIALTAISTGVLLGVIVAIAEAWYARNAAALRRRAAEKGVDTWA